MRKTDARMLQRQGPTERPKNASDRHVFSFMRIRAVPTTKMAGFDTSDVAPARGCTPTNPHGQAAPPTALFKLSCE